MNDKADNNLYLLMNKNSVDHIIAQNVIECEAAKAMGMIVMKSSDLLPMVKYDLLHSLYTSNISSIEDLEMRKVKQSLNTRIEQLHQQSFGSTFHECCTPVLLTVGIKELTSAVYEQAAQEICHDLCLNFVDYNSHLLANGNIKSENKLNFYFIKIENLIDKHINPQLFNDSAGGTMVFESFDSTSPEAANQLYSLIREKKLDGKILNNLLVGIVETSLEDLLNFSMRNRMYDAIPIFLKLEPECSAEIVLENSAKHKLR